MQEIQVNNLLNKAKILKTIAEDPLAKKVLEIELNAKSAKNKDLLTRLIRSLEQYVNKEDSLVYIGFVGHYSSGKSSTINNLLNINNTANQRSVGLNPTDKAITLITNTKNSNALILMNRETSIVPVRSILLDHDQLNNLVIADTPGSGDPQVVNEMIQDFLPICDYIIYFISAANPMDQADLPLLQQKAHKLPFIPITFIITRTDEFRLDKVKVLNDQNIDFPKRNQFIGQLLSRIKEIIKTDDISLEDFTFIDNEFKYGFLSLEEKIRTWSDNIDKEAVVQIHGYKVEYYKSNLNEIYNHFVTIIDDKIKKSKDFLKTANENIQRFDKSIELNNEKLKILWTRSDTIFKEVLLDERRVLNDISQDLSPRFVISGEKVQLEKKIIKRNIDDLVNGYTGKLVLDLNNHFKKKIREVKQRVLSNINEENILMENISHLFPGRIDFDDVSQGLDIDFSKLNDYSKSYQNHILEQIQETKNVVRNRMAQFKNLLSKEALIKSIIHLYEEGNKNIYENFDQYFEKIQMYRSTVLTRNTKETIERLRIGTQLDELDDEFSDEFISEMKEKAVSQVYFFNEEKIINLQKYNGEVNSKLKDARNSIDNLPSQFNADIQQVEKETIDVSSVSRSLINYGQAEINKIYQERLNNALEEHVSNFNAYVKTTRNIKKNRKRRIWKWFLIISVSAILGYIGLRFSSVIKPQTLTMDVIIALGTTALGNLIAYIISLFKLDVKKIGIKNKEQFLKQERNALLQQFNEDFWEDLSKKVSEPRTNTDSSFLRNLFSQRIEAALTEIGKNGQAIMEEIHKENLRIKTLISEYNTRTDTFYNEHALIFKHAEKNIFEIEQITKHIKETAIKPSFNLLKETSDSIEMVKAKIKNL